MNYYFKNNKWTAIPNVHSRYWELKEFGDCRKLELCMPQLPSFGWEKVEDSYKKKNFTTKEFIMYLKHQKKVHELMLERINKVLGKIK